MVNARGLQCFHPAQVASIVRSRPFPADDRGGYPTDQRVFSTALPPSISAATENNCLMPGAGFSLLNLKPIEFSVKIPATQQQRRADGG